jgi:hypothetical protein
MARLAFLLALAALALTGCAAAADPPALAPARPPKAPPDLARCDAQHVRREDDPLPGEPVTIPKAFRGIAKPSAVQMALLTRSGATLCHDMAWVFAIAKMGWLREDRLLGWEWYGHEVFGYTIFDRAGGGTVIETGVRPTFSPGGGRFASIEHSDFGALGGFAVWEMGADALVRIGGETSRWSGEGESLVLIEPPFFTERYGNWSIAGWRGETCVNIAFEGQEPSADAASAEIATVTRTFHAAESARWQITPGPCP